MRAVLATLAIIATTALAQTPPTIRLMPLGDSITQLGCWRALLFNDLQQGDNPYTYVDFVGSQHSNTTCFPSNYDRDHEGHAGYPAWNISGQNMLVGWLKQNPADIVMMHLGTVDIVLQNRTTANILKSYTTLVGQMRASNPNMRILVAQIIPIPSAMAQVNDLNAAIPAWAASLNTTASPITVVDQNNGFDASSMLKDGLHPNTDGDWQISNAWYPSLIQAIHGVQVLQGVPVQSGTERRRVRFAA